MPIISRLKVNECMPSNMPSFFQKNKIEEEFLEVGVNREWLVLIAICCNNMRLLTAVSENKNDMPSRISTYRNQCHCDILFTALGQKWERTAIEAYPLFQSCYFWFMDSLLFLPKTFHKRENFKIENNYAFCKYTLQYVARWIGLRKQTKITIVSNPSL